MAAGSIVLAGFAIFSFLLYQRVIAFARQPVLLAGEERPALFSPVLLDDIKIFWQKRADPQE